MVIVVLSVIFLLSNYNTLYRKLLSEYENNLSFRIENDVDIINREILHLHDDAIFLSKFDSARKLLQRYKNNIVIDSPQYHTEQAKLIQIFQSIIADRQNFFQIRLISYSGNGKEVVRVDKSLTDGKIAVTPNDKLQEKGRRAYVVDSKSIPFDHVFFSKIQLNREHGEISLPRVATIRAIVKIKSTDNIPLGIVVINYSIDGLFKQLVRHLLQDTNLYLWNSQGEFLIHPDSNKTFAFERGASSNVNSEFPEIVAAYNQNWTSLNGSDLTHSATSIESQTEDRLLHVGDYLFVAKTIILDNDKNLTKRPFTVALIGKYDEIIAPARDALFRLLIILLILLPMVVFTSILMSRRIAKPIEILNHAVTTYDRDNHDDFKKNAAVALSSTDEAGVLARSFLAMQENIKTIDNLVKNNETRLRLLLANMGDAVISVDSNGSIGFANQHAEMMFGYDQGELVGKNVSVIMTENDAKAHTKYISDYIASGRSEIMGMRRELTAKTKAGDLFFVEIVVSESKLDGEVTLTGVIRDVTKRKEEDELLKTYAEELQRSNEELNNFAYVASHDLKAPLRNIWQVISWIEDDIDNREELSTNLLLIKQRATKMQQLLDDLLEYSRVGRKNTDIEEFDASEVIREQFSLLNNSDSFQLKLVGEFPKLFHNRTMFELLLRNLIDNAIKYHDKENGLICVLVKESTDYFEFTIQDNGPGIEPEYIHKIFDFLQRINTKVEGSGIGLSLVKKILDNIGGSISVESIMGEGTTFHICWPKNTQQNEVNLS